MNLIDAWYKAAADSDQKAYFGFIADDGVYIGILHLTNTW